MTASATIIQMTGEEVARKIVKGERDFRGIAVREGYDFSKNQDLAEYLEKEYKGNADALKFDYSELSGSTFNKLNLFHLSATGAHIKWAFFRETNLDGAAFHGADLALTYFHQARIDETFFMRANLLDTDFSGAWLYRASFAGANLRHANFSGTRCCRANFGGADIYQAKFYDAVLKQVDFRSVKNLRQAEGLETAFFSQTIATPYHRRVIKGILKNRPPELIDIRHENWRDYDS